MAIGLWTHLLKYLKYFEILRHRQSNETALLKVLPFHSSLESHTLESLLWPHFEEKKQKPTIIDCGEYLWPIQDTGLLWKIVAIELLKMYSQDECVSLTILTQEM